MIKLQLLLLGINNLKRVIYVWRNLLKGKNTSTNLFFSQLNYKPTLESISLRFRKEWVVIDYISYFTLYECPQTKAYWLEYADGWGSPARYVAPNENLMDVVREMECCQY